MTRPRTLQQFAGSRVLLVMRNLVFVVLLAGCDQGVVEKPKPAPAVPPAPATKHAPSAPFTTNAWHFIEPLLTFSGHS